MKASELAPVDAARVLGVGRLYVYELLASGRIKGRKVLGRWLLSKESVDAYRRKHSRPGSRLKRSEADNE